MGRGRGRRHATSWSNSKRLPAAVAAAAARPKQPVQHCRQFRHLLHVCVCLPLPALRSLCSPLCSAGYPQLLRRVLRMHDKYNCNTLWACLK